MEWSCLKAYKKKTHTVYCQTRRKNIEQQRLFYSRVGGSGPGTRCFTKIAFSMDVFLWVYRAADQSRAKVSHGIHPATLDKRNWFLIKFQNFVSSASLKIKEYIAMTAHNLKSQYPESDPKFSKNSEKFRKLQGEHTRHIFNKISDM